MRNYSFLRELNIDSEAFRGLTFALDGVVMGKEKPITTPFASDVSKATNILSEWDKIFKRNIGVINSPLYDLEMLNRSKFGPRSIAIPWEERKESVFSTFEAESGISNLNTRLTPINKSKCTGRLRPLSDGNAMRFLRNDTNSGLPFFTRKSRVKNEVLANLDNLLKRKDPCVMFTRTQEGKKTRTVWGYPIADSLFEMKYYRPLLGYQKELPWRAALNGPEKVDEQITTLINTAKNEKKKLLSIDFSSYDSSVKNTLQRESFNYIKSLFQADSWRDLDYISERFNTIGLVTPDGILSGPHGVPSGSTFTNEVDSIAQFLIARRVLDPSDPFQIQGDDGAYCVSDPEALKREFRSFGLTVSDEKSYISDNYLIYLQNLFSEDYRDENGNISGIHPTYRALNRLCYQERFDNFVDYGLKGRDYYAIRSISILENCKHHPLFKDLVKFILKRDKYGLKPSEEGIRSYVKMVKDKVGSRGLILNQYSDMVEGIRSFETFKLVSSL